MRLAEALETPEFTRLAAARPLFPLCYSIRGRRAARLHTSGVYLEPSSKHNIRLSLH